LLQSERRPLAGASDNIESFHVAQAGDSIVGSAGIELHGDYALLRSVAVSEALKGRGIGKQLVTEAIDDARRRGVQAVYLLTTPAESYFPGFGFEKVERSSIPSDLHASEELKGACPATATVMRKSL
jgi:amino-acid N-acetyltransferase